MRYVKSFLAGVFAVLGSLFVLLLALVIGMVGYNVLHPPAVGAHPWDPISSIYQKPAVWLTAALIFCAAFLWRYRRFAR